MIHLQLCASAPRARMFKSLSFTCRVQQGYLNLPLLNVWHRLVHKGKRQTEIKNISNQISSGLVKFCPRVWSITQKNTGINELRIKKKKIIVENLYSLHSYPKIASLAILDETNDDHKTTSWTHEKSHVFTGDHFHICKDKRHRGFPTNRHPIVTYFTQNSV